MSKALVTESHLEDIADAIREKLGVATTYRPGDMAAAILAIPTGGGSTLVSKTITQNGEYDPEDDNADGYSDVTVNVPNSYTAEDEGKVVSSGALVAQTSTTVTQNGTYDTTENDEVVVNVPGGGGGGCTVLQCSPYNSNNPIKPGVAGRFKLIVIAINSEASNHNLDIGVTVNQTAITGETLDYNSYSSSGNNRQNYRINEYDVNVSYTDTITLSLANGGNYTSLFYVLGTIDINGFFQVMSTPDNITTGSYSSKAFVIYGISNNNSGGSIFANTVNANETITTPDPIHSYGSSFIFWIDGDLTGGQGGGSDGVYVGTSIPAASLGDNGDYYYKRQLMGEYGYSNTPTASSSTKQTGYEFTANESISIVGLRAYNANSTGTASLILATSDGTILKQVDDVAFNGNWVYSYFDTPVQLTAGNNYIVQAVSNLTGFRYQSKGTAGFNSKITGVCGRYNSLPGSIDSSNIYSADIIIGADTGIYIVETQYYKENGAWVQIP